MPNYLLRVQLSVETDRNYTTLRDKLLAIGYTKRIKDKHGVEWRLPNGNYYVEAKATIESVMRKTKNVINSVDLNAMVVLAEVPAKGGMMWYGLQKC